MTAKKRTKKTKPERRKGWHPHVTRSLVVAGVLALVAVGTYARLAIGPVQVPFLNDTISHLITENLPDGFTAEFSVRGVMLENGVRPMVVISPFKITEVSSGAVVSMQSVRVAFAPIQALFGRPAADLILDAPHVQAVQDFRGIRLATLHFATNQQGESTVRILANESDPRALVINESGIEMGDTVDAELISDNDWIVIFVNDMENLLAGADTRFEDAELRQIEIRNASVEVMDQIYRLYRHFESINILLKPDGQDVSVRLETEIGQRSTTGQLSYARTAEASRISGRFSNIDLAVFIPMLDDEEGLFSLKGGSEMELSLDFAPGIGITQGRFETDLAGTVLEVQDISYPIVSENTVVEWLPRVSTFKLEPTRFQIGESVSTLEGTFALGVDDKFGPTVGMYLKATDTFLNPNDLEPATEPIEVMEMHGWMAGVYGAMGIDRMTMQAGDMQIEGSGRVDFLQRGVGFDVDLRMRAASVDQVKRIWPYFVAGDIRDIFVEQVKAGSVKEANLSLDLEAGVVTIDGFVAPRVPEGGVFIDAVTTDIELGELGGGLTIDIEGDTRVRMEDNAITLNVAKGSVVSGGKRIGFTSLAYYNTELLAKDQLFEVSVDASGGIAELTSIANQEPFRLLEGIDLGISPEDLTGDARMTIIAQVAQDASGRMTGRDYTINGTVENFASLVPIEGRLITDGRLTLIASQAGYKVTGEAKLEGVPTELVIETGETGEMQLTAAAVLDEEARKALGFDFGEFIGGTVRYVARPESETVLQIAVDLTEASLTIDDIGVTKPVGEPGTVTAAVSQDGDITTIDRLDLTFGTVHLTGSMQVSAEHGLVAANFDTFVLNPDDNASLSVTPIEGGFRVSITGEQLDLKPVLSRFLGLSNESAAARSATDTAGKVIELALNLERALGFYKTTAFNANFNLTLLGNKLLHADAQAQLGGDKSMSITTNSLPQGRVLTVAVNDFGTLLRFIGTYPRIVGGEGSLVMTTNDPNQQDRGEFVINNFSVVDEAVVAQILGNHASSRDLISRQNRIEFTRGRAVFVRTGDHLTVAEGALHGERIGGTLRGTIFTKEGRYDLVGTYVPLFGFNNLFQQLPLVGRLIGGREGEGLIGVTFKVEGPLDSPQFRINPASILAPGVLRQLFEFRTEDVPEASLGGG